jgi:hypothetical protein
MLTKIAAAAGIILTMATAPVLADTAVVDLTPDQQVEIHKDITSVQVDPIAKPDFDVTVGTVVPKTVKLHKLPDTVVKVVPSYSSDEFFTLDDGRIAIVDPDSLKIVAIVKAD